MTKIAIMESLGVSREELLRLEEPFLDRNCIFESFDRTADAEKLIEEARDADAMIIANMPLNAQVIEGCKKLKFIDIAFTGVDHVAMDAVRAQNIIASNASGYSNEAVAELALGMAIALMRNITAVERRCREGKTKEGLVGFELAGKTVGIIGLGRIGRRSAQLFHAMGCDVISHSRTIHPDRPEYVREVELEELLRDSDIVALHCPLNASTRGMINADAIKKMKRTALLINVARGPVVVSSDLKQALNDGVIAGAGIDVFDAEPPLSREEPLLDAKNTLLTPHVAFATHESMSLRARIVFDNLAAWLDGKPINVVR